MMHEAIACPFCGMGFSRQAMNLECASCGRRFETVDGIPCLAQNPEFYYGEIPQTAMNRLLDEIAKSGWEKGFRAAMGEVEDPSFFIEYALREGRAGWMFLLPIHLKPRILDVGCGPGAIACALARQGCEVFAVDTTLARLKFLQVRARELGLNAVIPVQGGDTPFLPFPPDFFDLVILNGILEWVPRGSQLDPREAQIEFLRQVRRVLKPEGEIYIGIENRYNYNYFMGSPEDHTGVKYVSLMPRALANVYMLHEKGKRYTTWTYSRAGYSRLLRKAGFLSTKFYLPVPDYRSFTRVVDPESENSVSSFYAAGHRRRRVPSWCQPWLARNLAPAFGIIACRQGQLKENFLERLLQKIPEIQQTTAQDSRHARIDEYLVTGTDTVVAKVSWPPSADSWMVKLPTSQGGLENCRQQEQNLVKLRATLADPDSAFPEISQPVVSGHLEGIPYFVEKGLPGIPGERVLLLQGESGNWKRNAAQFLIRLSRDESRRRVVNDMELARWVDALTAPLALLVAKDFSLQVKEITNFVRDSLSGRILPHIITHGDYWAGNLLFNESDGALTGVVDWDRASFASVSVRDILHLLLYTDTVNRGLPVPSAILLVARGGFRDDANARIFGEYCDAIGLDISPRLRAALCTLYWLEFLRDRIGNPRLTFRLNPEWIRVNLLDFVPEFLQLAHGPNSASG